MTDLFVSYSRRDQDFVRELHNTLEKTGKDVWVDWENIPLTAEWLQEIYDGIEAGDAFAYVITPDSVRSEVCSLELAHAISHNKRLVPILRRDLVEDMDKKALDPKISSHNWIYYRETDDNEKAFQSLIDALDTDLDYLKRHTRLLLKAVEWNDKERDTGLVLRGNDLSLAVQWLQQSTDKQPNPTDLQREYVLASQRAAAARFRALVLYAAYGVVVILLAGFAILQATAAEQRRQEAVEQRRVAEVNADAALAAKATAVYNGDQARSLALASNAQQILYRDKNPELALALSLIANTSIANPPLLAQGALAQAAYFPGTRAVLDQGIVNFSRVATDVARQRVLFVNRDNTLVLMELDTQEIIQQWPTSDVSDTINSLALTSDGAYAAAGHTSGKIQIYNTEDGTAFKEFSDEASGTLWDIEFSPDDRFLVTACSDGRARVWDWRTGEETVIFSDHVEENAARGAEVIPSLYGLDIRPDSQAVLTVDDSLGLLMLWDIETGERLQMFEADAGAGRTIAFLPNGTSALVGYDDTIMRLIDLEENLTKREFVAHSLTLWDIVVNDAGTEALSASFDNSIIHWDLTTGDSLEEFKGHAGFVYGVALAGSRFVSASSDGTLRYWDLASGAQIDYLNVQSPISQILNIENADQELVIVGAADGIVHVLDSHLIPQRTIVTPENLTTLDVNESLDLLATGTGNGQITIWTLSTGEQRAQTTFDFGVLFLDMHLNGQWIALVGASADIVLWNWETDERRSIPTATAEEIEGRNLRIKSVQFSPDGTQILVGGLNGISNSVYLFDFDTGALIRKFSGHTGIIYGIDFSVDGRYIATSSEDNTFIVWRVDESEPPRYFYGHTGDVATVLFSPNSRLLVSGGYDRTIRLWDMNTTSEIQRFDTSSVIVSEVFDAQSSTIVTGDSEGNLQHWQIRDLPALLQWIDENRYVPPLTCEQKKLYQISTEVCEPEAS